MTSLLASLVIIALSIFQPLAEVKPIMTHETANALKQLNVQPVWTAGHRGSGATVAFIDSEIDIDNPMFSGGRVGGYCIITEETEERCPNGKKTMTGPNSSVWEDGDDDHGNMVAGILRTVAPDASIVPIRAIGGTEALNKSLDYLIENAKVLNLKVLSLSFGVEVTPTAIDMFGREALQSGKLTCEEVVSAIDGAGKGFVSMLELLNDLGIAIFVASGNNPSLNFNNYNSPSCLKSTIAVGSMNMEGDVAWYTTMSTDVEFLGPDAATVPSGYGDGTQLSGGTSAATPFVAGVYALLASAFPNMTKSQILLAMKETATRVDDIDVKNLALPNAEEAYKFLQNFEWCGDTSTEAEAKGFRLSIAPWLGQSNQLDQITKDKVCNAIASLGPMPKITCVLHKISGGKLQTNSDLYLKAENVCNFLSHHTGVKQKDVRILHVPKRYSQGRIVITIRYS